MSLLSDILNNTPTYAIKEFPEKMMWRVCQVSSEQPDAVYCYGFYLSLNEAQEMCIKLYERSADNRINEAELVRLKNENENLIKQLKNLNTASK